MQKKIDSYDLWSLLSHTYRLVSKMINRELRPLNISHIQAYILFIIQALGDKATPTMIARYTIQEHNSITEILNRMVKRGLVVKTNIKHNGKRIKVALTEEGIRIYNQLVKRKSINSVIGELSNEKKQHLWMCLEILRDTALSELGLEKSAPELRLSPSQYKQNLNSDLPSKM